MSLFVFWLLYMRSTFPGTELDFLLKLTSQPKNNPPQEREGEGRGERGEMEVRRNRERDEEEDRVKQRVRWIEKKGGEKRDGLTEGGTGNKRTKMRGQILSCV